MTNITCCLSLVDHRMHVEATIHGGGGSRGKKETGEDEEGSVKKRGGHGEWM